MPGGPQHRGGGQPAQQDEQAGNRGLPGGGQEEERARAPAWGRGDGQLCEISMAPAEKARAHVRGEAGSEAEKGPVRRKETKGQSCT
jgi:hypothetical protein